MSRFALLVLDLDLTLIATPPFRGDLAEWMRLILASDPPPVRGAIEGVAQLRRAHPTAAPVILSARSALSVPLRRASERALLQFHPLAGAPLVHCGDEDPSHTGLVVKRPALARIRAAIPGPMLLVEDDPQAIELVGPGDMWLQAPGVWEQIAVRVA